MAFRNFNLSMTDTRQVSLIGEMDSKLELLNQLFKKRFPNDKREWILLKEGKKINSIQNRMSMYKSAETGFALVYPDEKDNLMDHSGYVDGCLIKKSFSFIQDNMREVPVAHKKNRELPSCVGIDINILVCEANVSRKLLELINQEKTPAHIMLFIAAVLLQANRYGNTLFNRLPVELIVKIFMHIAEDKYKELLPKHNSKFLYFAQSSVNKASELHCAETKNREVDSAPPKYIGKN